MKFLLLGLFISKIVIAGSYVAHEWGTFTALQGSNGKNLIGMHHEEEALPAFVHARDSKSVIRASEDVAGSRRCQNPKCIEFPPNGVTQKLETPVIYFYAPKPHPVKVEERRG